MALKKIGIFGSTGSIGTQALEIIKQFPNKFKATILVANENVELLIQQAIEFKPEIVVIGNQNKYNQLLKELSGLNIKILKGNEGILEASKHNCYDFMIAAISGFNGIFSVIEAIKNNKKIGLANKESIVVAGQCIMDLCKQYNVDIIPIDSEHSAIFQCILGEKKENINKVVLTASGGPFRGKKPNFLINIKKEHALQHPIWKMGKKISIDSATLMNKGLEIIEAKWLFDLEESQIDVIVHPECIIHSIVEFKDGNYKAQLSNPSMHFPIQFALTYPDRIETNFKGINFLALEKLNFEIADSKTFRCLQLAREALIKGGNFPAILNIVNEEAVEAFLSNKIKFLEIPDVIENSMSKISYIQNINIEDLINLNIEYRLVAKKEIDKLKPLM